MLGAVTGLALAGTIIGFLAPWVPVPWLPELQLVPIAMPLLLPVWLFWLWRAARLRSWKIATLSIAGLLLCGHVLLKDRGGNETTAQQPDLTVISYNVGTFDFSEKKVIEIGNLLENQNVDLIAMQEFRNHDLGEGVSAMKYLAEKWNLPHHHFLHLPHHVHGAAFFSRYPILAIDTLFLPKDEINSGILVTVETEKGKVGIANVHFSSFHIQAIYDKEPDMKRRFWGIHARAKKALALQQDKVNMVLKELKSYPHPVLIVGDFNAIPHSAIIRQVEEQYQDAFRVAGEGWGWTFPVLGQLGIRIDYQFASPNLQPLGLKVIRKAASDHYPMLGTYQLKL